MMAKTHAPLSAAVGGAFAFTYMQWETINNTWSSTVVGGFVDQLSKTMNAATSAMTWSQIALCFIVTMSIGGYALAPDFDEPGATIAKKTGLIGSVLSPLVRAIAGGHRKGTHSVFTVIGLSLMGWYAAQNIVSWVFIAAFGCYLSVALVMGTKKWGIQAAAVVLVAIVAYVAFDSITPVIGAAIVGGGALLHDIEDMIAGKIKFFWPVPVSVGLDIITTDGPVENMVVRPLANIAVALVLVGTVIVPTAFQAL